MIFLLACSTSKNGRISGTINNAPQKELTLNRIEGKQNIPIEKVQLSEDGAFNFDIKDLEPGVYSLQIKNKRMLFALDGTEKSVQLAGDFNDLSNMNYTVSGSPASLEIQALMKKANKRQLNIQDFKDLVASNKNAMVVAMIIINYLPFDKRTLAIHQAAQQKLAAAYPDAKITKDYGSILAKLENNWNSRLKNKRVEMPSSSAISIGAMAPEIELPDPSGKTRKLSDLRGKVVVLDFWASWCGPCRRMGNPELVKLYKKHKNEKFAIFNVALERSPKNDKWIEAIKKDGMVWPDQVIDRSKKSALIYNVRGIPKTFVIDKDGKIVAINLHGQALEQSVEELLSK